MTKCPECEYRLFTYKSGDWSVLICWRCGHYESDSPAFRSCPELFKNLVRKNPIAFLAQLKPRLASDDSYQQDESDDKLPEPGYE